MGPIAPRRDVGEANGAYGALDLQRAQLPPVPKKARKRYVEFAEKDRAVVIRGPEKGKIGTVREVNVETQSVQLNGINLVCTSRPLSAIESVILSVFQISGTFTTSNIHKA